MEQTPETTNNKHGRDMTIGSIPRHMVMFSLPMLAGNSVQAAYSIMNAVWVGKFLGKNDLAAVAVSFPITFLLLAIAIGLTMGTSILVAQFAGARRWDRVRTVVQTSTVVLIVVSSALLLIGELATPWILRAMKTPSDVYPLAASYLRIYLITTPFAYAFFLVMSMMRGIGDSKTPLYFQTGSLLLCGILDPLLMLGWLGFPRMGLNGTAVAAVIAQALGMAALFIHLYRKDHLVAPDWLHLSMDRAMFWAILKIGLPSVVQQALISVGMAFVLKLVNDYGPNATAAFGATMRIDQLAFLPAMTFGVAVSTMVGQNLGAGRMHRVKEIFGWAVLLCGGTTLLISLLSMIAPHLLLTMFLNDAAPMRIGVGYLHIAAITYMMFAVMLVANGVINGAGHTLISTIITLVALWAARIPLATYLSHHMHRVEGIWYAMLISSVISVTASLACYFAGVWKRPVVKHGLVPEAAAVPVVE